MSRENVEIVRRVYEAWNRYAGTGFEEAASNPEVVALVGELFDPDVEVQQLADIPGTGGTFRGYEGLLASAGELMADLDDIQFTLGENFEVGELVVFAVTASGKGRTSQVPAEMRLGHLWELRDGRVVRWVVYPTADAALEAVGLGE
jgi:ketosteroid isomerase-like protein